MAMIITSILRVGVVVLFICAGCSGERKESPLAHVALMVAPSKCAPDAVQVGPTCVDVYEASVWSIRSDREVLIAKVQAGTASLADLTKGDATQVRPAAHSAADSCDAGSSFPDTFPENGNWTEPLYAVSVQGVQPTVCVTWFQAEQACALSGKRLLTNQEWQRAAARTPDGSPCVVSGSVGPTGTEGCFSNWLAYDMVGNVWEWVADWGELATSKSCTKWPNTPGGTYGNDASCVGRVATVVAKPDDACPGGEGLPGARHRGGDATSGAEAGVFTISDGNGCGRGTPAYKNSLIGFRCGR